MIILSIETSCDDTCISIIKVKSQRPKVKSFDILSNIISSQVKIHKKFGGVYPAMAKREHQYNLVSVLKRALKKAKLLKSKTSIDSRSKNQKISQIKNEELRKILEREPKLFKKLLIFFKKYQKSQINVIAVTIGPGLEPCLWTGVNLAKALAYMWGLPIVPVNHIEGHIFANWLMPISSKSKIKKQKSKCNLKIKKEKIEFPAVCLIVSGGHTQLILVTNFGKYKIIGETRDDAAGECFDKTARILGLGYPGGPAIAELARQKKNQITNSKLQTNSKFKIQNSKFNIKLPRPMIYSKDYDFSFSGLKTAVLYKVKDQSTKAEFGARPSSRQDQSSGLRLKIKDERYVQAMCKEIQQAIIDVLIYKTLKAAKNYQVKTIILGGGVTANDELRKQFHWKLKIENWKFKLLIPSKAFCTDNAAMIGITAFFNRQKKTKNLKNIKADANLRIDK